VDAWTTYKDVPVGAVYLTRKGDEVVAFNLKCPHLGCAIDFRKQSNDYFCPCHNSSFALDGSVTTENSPSPRPMDTMETKVEKGMFGFASSNLGQIFLKKSHCHEVDL